MQIILLPFDLMMMTEINSHAWMLCIVVDVYLEKYLKPTHKNVKYLMKALFNLQQVSATEVPLPNKCACVFFQSFIHDIFSIRDNFADHHIWESITRMNAAFVQHFLEKKISLQKLSGTA